MDDYVKAFLREWQLEELIAKFEDEEVNEKAFKCLTDDIIRELIPKLGKRAIFINAYKAYREALDRNGTLFPAKVKQNDDPLPTFRSAPTAPVKLESAICKPSDGEPSEHNITVQIEMLPPETVKLETVAPTITPPLVDGDVPATPLETTTSATENDENPEPTRITFCIGALENPSDEDRRTADSLRQFLSTSDTVQHLLGKTFLTRSSRNLLVKEIVDYLFVKNKGILSNRLLRCWARAVEQVFHDEISGLYFREMENGSACGGKLAQYYEQLKQMKGVDRSR